ncbi:hypothetical protein GCM10020001_036130 [Nonomuraea salmonea]
MRRLLAIVNAAAGGAGDDVVADIMTVLHEHADTAQVRLDDPGALAKALDEHPDRDPVVLGGDGTLHTLVATLSERDELATRTVGLIPLGTGNDLARGLGIPLDPVEAARAAASGRPRPLDLLRDDEGGIVVNAVHIGVGVEAARTATPLKPVLRRFAYAVGSLVAGARTKGLPLKVEVDGQVVADGRRRVLMVGIGNGTSIGGGTPSPPTPAPPTGSRTWSSRSPPARCSGSCTGCCSSSAGTPSGRRWSPYAERASTCPGLTCTSTPTAS